MYVLRFDMRAPAGRTPELYAAALDMAEWGEENGCLAVVLSEHHASPDGFLPSPLMLASAIAARTESLRIIIAATVLPLYDPVRLAEDISVLDNISGGRASIVFGLGYRPEEFALYGREFAERAAIVEEHLPVVIAALRTGRVDHGGRSGPVTPVPATPGGPPLSYGGSSIVAARRAGRFGLDFFAQTDDPALGDAYRDAADAHGHEPGSVTLPSPDEPYAMFVADDLDAAWEELGPHLLHDAVTYSSWNARSESTASLSHSTTVEDLRAEHGSHQIFTVEEAKGLVATKGYLTLHPLCGGVPPEVAWPYLERVANEVLVTGD